MKLSENQELVQKLDQILQDYPGLEYDKQDSARMDEILMIKVSPNVEFNVNSAAKIAKRLSEVTGDQYKVQPHMESQESSFINLRGFGLILFTPNKNIRITYPDNKNGKLEVDVIVGMEISLDLHNSQLWSFAKGNDLEIHLNIFAEPNYRKFLRTHVLSFTRSNKNLDNNRFSNFELKQATGNNTDSSNNLCN